MPTETAVEVVPVEYQKQLQEFTNLERQATELAHAIKDDKSYRAACDFRIKVNEQRKAWAVAIKPSVQAAHQAHQKIKDVEKLVDRPLANSLMIVDPSISRWDTEQENLRRIQQEEINRKLKKDEEDRRIKEAEALHDSGQAEEAERVLEAPIQAPQVVLPSTTKVAGIQNKTYWSAEVWDMVKLCRAVGEGKVDPMMVLPNEPELNAMARRNKDAMNAQWEKFGVRAVSRKDIAGGGR